MNLGFGPRGASLADLHLMKKALEKYPNVRIKAAGGIRNREDALAFIQAGASRLGTSKGVELLTSSTQPTIGPAKY